MLLQAVKDVIEILGYDIESRFVWQDLLVFFYMIMRKMRGKKIARSNVIITIAYQRYYEHTKRRRR